MAPKRKRSALDVQKAKKPKSRAGDRAVEAPPTLFTIPKELRDQIYEDVLLEPDDKSIDVSDKNTCRQAYSLSASRHVRKHAGFGSTGIGWKSTSMGAMPICVQSWRGHLKVMRDGAS
ncbi:hypothetical protein AC579_123 [Pseudocercospora musae]|uniref:Uncharacterized protein n=1 Tax=Pseudocercospora musae TaxID=113226 RepID=A0A139ILU0_9PEZI|nr:hypothetical protein AC579_123 [Pseudocercospora musae]